MVSEERLVENMVDFLWRKKERVQRLLEEKDKLLVKAKIVMGSCFVVARADGEVSDDEFYLMHKNLFKKYCITASVYKYLFASMNSIDIPALKWLVEKYEIDGEFLSDLYWELEKLAKADGDESTDEWVMLLKLRSELDIDTKEPGDYEKMEWTISDDEELGDPELLEGEY